MYYCRFPLWVVIHLKLFHQSLPTCSNTDHRIVQINIWIPSPNTHKPCADHNLSLSPQARSFGNVHCAVITCECALCCHHLYLKFLPKVMQSTDFTFLLHQGPKFTYKHGFHYRNMYYKKQKSIIYFPAISRADPQPHWLKVRFKFQYNGKQLSSGWFFFFFF